MSDGPAVQGRQLADAQRFTIDLPVLPKEPPKPQRPWRAPRKASRELTPNDNLFPADLATKLRALNLPTPIPYLDDPAAASPYVLPETATLKVFATSDSGHGVALGKDNWLVLVPTVLEGETVVARIYRDGEGFSIGELLEVTEKSPLRVDAQCKYFGRCGGCGLQHLRYDEQLRRKGKMVARAYEGLLADAGTKVTVEPVVPSPMQYGYRTKMSPHYEQRRAGVPLTNIGFNERGRKTVLDVDHCPIVTKEINVAYGRARERLILAANPSYTLGSTLLFRHSLLLPDQNSPAARLRLAPLADALKSPQQRRQLAPLTSPTSWPPAEAKPLVITEGRDIVTDSINGLTLSYPAHSFFQTNSSILPDLLTHIRSQLRATIADHGLTTAIDAYCGAGIFALACAADFKNVYGIEVDAKSIDWASKNATANGVKNVTFYKGSAERIFESLDRAATFPDPDRTAVIMDPPAKGAGPDFMDQLYRFNPKVVVYVSCNVQSQTRDLGLLMDGTGTPMATAVGEDRRTLANRSGENGSKVLYIGGNRVELKQTRQSDIPHRPFRPYRIANVQPFDMFPQTAQLETVVVLVRD
ncbi:tRNA(m5U54)methyltransferase [Thoreauomyces humboldtii]|nr:tRNA(m5U54)methyltransferase [Thoreauomyces humboldtii]